MIDLHMHTVYSDGDRTVEEILKQCEEKHLEYISITDHNNCMQYKDEAFNKNIFSGKVIKGVELQGSVLNKNIEILAYDYNWEILNEWIQKHFSEEKLIERHNNQKERLFKICDKNGLKYDKNNIVFPKDPTAFVESSIYKEVIRYEENQIKLGEYATNFGLFFRKGLTNSESPYYMEYELDYPSYEEIVENIHNAGGKAFLAHPFEYKFENTIEFIDDIRKIRELDGIECYHPSAEEDNRITTLKEYARKNNLYISGGSDYHGSPKPDIEIATGKGSLQIPKEVVEEWHRD